MPDDDRSNGGVDAAPDGPPKAKGKAPRLTGSALAKLAEITPDEIAEAAAWWAEVAPAKWRGLIDAKLGEAGE